jgi:two-component system OmpR family sensor kinase
MSGMRARRMQTNRIRARPMRSLFWRIFLSLWLGSTVLMIGTSLLIAAIAEREVPEQVLDRVGTLLRGNAHNLLQLYTRVDDREFAEAVAAFEKEYALAVYFVDDSGRELLDRRLPAELRDFDRTFSRQGKTLTIGGPLRGGALIFGERMRAPDGREYRAIGSALGPPLPSINLILGAMLAPLLFSVVLAGFFSALSARYLVVPIDDLRRATRQLAAGDLDSRVGAALRERSDEFGALAADFDRMADRIGALIGTQRQLMFDLSHELRSPLARLRVALELMRDEPRPALLDRMERDADRMDILIGELLLLARLESPESELPQARIDLAELLTDIVEDARLEIAGQPRALHLDIGGNVATTVVGDRELLLRAIENVIRNAVQHTPENADVHVILGHDDGGARIRVIDGGEGISAETMAGMFAPFARGDSPRQRQGNGLGLAIARAAVQRHGGGISIAARDDRNGTVVDIRLPLPMRLNA